LPGEAIRRNYRPAVRKDLGAQGDRIGFSVVLFRPASLIRHEKLASFGNFHISDAPPLCFAPAPFRDERNIRIMRYIVKSVRRHSKGRQDAKNWDLMGIFSAPFGDYSASFSYFACMFLAEIRPARARFSHRRPVRRFFTTMLGMTA
jgi:hypothetical protein